MAIQFYSDNYGDGARLELSGRCHTLEVGDSQATNALDYLAFDAWPRAFPLYYDYLCVPGSNSSQTIANNLGMGNSTTYSKDVDLAILESATNYDIAGQATTITAVSSGAATTFTTGTNSHGIVNGETVTIAGTYTGLTGWTNGSYVATVTGYNTFTVPVATSGSATPSSSPTVTTPARTGMSARVMGPIRATYFPRDTAANTAVTANGIMLPRQTASASNPHTNANRTSPHPSIVANNGLPWFYGTYMKAKYVMWYSAKALAKFAIYAFRQGNGVSSTTTASSRTQVDLTTTVFPDDPEGPVSSGWTPPVNDESTASGYYTTVASGGVKDDHEVAIRSYTSSATYDETDKSFMPLCAVFARCDIGGVMFGGRSYGCGYDAMGRAGATVTDWLNYCTAQDWQYYFAATMLVPDGRVKIRLRFGHNLETTDIDANIGDGAVKEYDSGAADKLAHWRTRYVAFIERLRAAFAAAVAAGQLPAGSTLRFELEVPWVSGEASKTSEIPSEINAAVKQVAAETGASWFSFIDYWNSLRPFYTLHAYTPAHGQMLAQARLDAMNRATNQEFTTAGAIPESRQFRGALRV